MNPFQSSRQTSANASWFFELGRGERGGGGEIAGRRHHCCFAVALARVVLRFLRTKVFESGTHENLPITRSGEKIVFA